MRTLTTDEKQFLSSLIEKSGKRFELPEKVLEMKDGGMGSLSFDENGENIRAFQIIGGNFLDSDGILVDFELTADENGKLFELDIWKIDFSKLIALPEIENIIITSL